MDGNTRNLNEENMGACTSSIQEPRRATLGVPSEKSSAFRCSSPARELNAAQQCLNVSRRSIGENVSAGKFRREGLILSYSGSLSDYYEFTPKVLGQGTYGSVCQAVHKVTGSVRAVKTIAKAAVKNIERFRNEIAIMKRLDHPNILKLYETFEDHKNIYLVLELCSGGELFDRVIEEGYFTEMYAGTLMRHILTALYYIHAHKIVHRDLKPENFLFLNKSKDSPLKIIDFGLAAYCTETSLLRTKAGTPYYVAPQVLLGSYTQKCDLWSAGVIMYILLCGYPPFHGENDAEVLQKVRIGKFSFNQAEWKNISREGQDLIAHLLVYDPDERYSAEQALNHPWIQHYSTKQNPLAFTPFDAHILDNFRSFRALSKLKKAALTVIAQQMSEGEIANLKRIFMVLDEDGDGTLTIQEIRKGLQRSGLKEIPPDLDQLMQDIDSDGSGVIDYTEFLAASIDKRQYIHENVCWAAFSVFDVDGNGKISAQELLQVLGNDTVQEMIEDRNVEEMKQLIEDVDKNGDGEIDFDEFMDMMRKKT